MLGHVVHKTLQEIPVVVEVVVAAIVVVVLVLAAAVVETSAIENKISEI